MRRRLATAALVLASILAALGIAELVLILAGDALVLPRERFSFRWMVYDPVFSWRNVPGTWTKRYYGPDGTDRPVELHVNSRGFRGPEISDPKPSGVTRIVCMGDSATFGIINNPAPGRGTARMVPIESYPEALARRLEREAPGRFEVINAGVIGYSSSHGLRQLVLVLQDLEPDWITVRYGVNDSQPSWAPWHRSHEPASPWLRETYYAIADRKLARLSFSAWRSVPFLHPEPESVPWATPGRYRRNLERMIEVARAREARVLLLDYPLAPPTDDPALEAERRPLRRALARLGAISRAVAREGGAAWLETRARLAAHRPSPFDPADDIHPNAHGAAALADRIAARVLVP